MPRYDDDDDDRDDDVPRKKKKKKKKPPPSNWPKIVAYVGVGVVILALIPLIIWAIMAVSGGGPPAQPVTAWERYSTDDLGFAFDYPKGWGCKGYGKNPNRIAEIKAISSGATIKVNENLAGSLVGDIAGAAAAGQPVDDSRSPVAQVHAMRRPKEPASYKEEPAISVQTKLGKVRRSAYSDGSRRGYRVTALLHQTALDIFCDCRASDWDVLRPAFDHFIESLSVGGG